ncbi:MAG TPA: hypothetical protein VFF94_03275, partial [Novosphingobium sp.]|nr:hypothetical protein [Novosphingobium sp.]
VTSDSLLSLFLACLTADGATAAGSRVYKPGDWPAQSGQLPVIKLRILRENRQSAGRGTVMYTTTATIRVMGEVESYAEPDNAGAAAAEGACWALKRQIEVAIVNSYALFMRIQQIASIDSQLAYNSEGRTHVAAIIMDFAVEFFEDSDSFAAIAADDAADVLLSATNYAPDVPVSADISLNP